MTKRKKRNKQYQGEDAAAPTQKNVHHYTAVVRSPLGEWWLLNKRRIRILAIIIAVVSIGGWFITEAVRMIFFR